MSPMVTRHEKFFEQYEGENAETTDKSILVIVFFSDIDSGLFYPGRHIFC